MSNGERQIRLGAFIMATGHHIAAWRHPLAEANAGHNIDHYRHLAQEPDGDPRQERRLVRKGWI